MGFRHTAFILLTAAATCAAIPAAAQWAAIAQSEATDRVGWGSGYGSKQLAINSAIASCGQRDCQLVTSFVNQCAALVQSGNSKFYLLANSEGKAGANAMQACIREGLTNCKWVISMCSWRATLKSEEAD